ncbi:MAG: response regulator [Desulfobulbaceae bacterium]|uniref:histidine kinase n=1 Tax=Candidatus Desulfatifera sulfidica TaxID=2841691 RepID=A0A8J6N9I1_9BACT|nr:response regulator [Candidatus Desulfatifera sulfidica]
MSPLRYNSLPTPLRIMLVEDSEHDLIAFRRAILENRPDTVITHAYRAEELLDNLDTLNDNFDLLVTDYKLPGITGLELCRRIMTDNINIPCVILSGAGSEQVVLEAFQTGVSDYLIKDSYQDYLRILPQVLKQAVRNFRNRQYAELFHQQRKLIAGISEIFLTNEEDLTPLYEQTAHNLARELDFPVSLILYKENGNFIVKAFYGIDAPGLQNTIFSVEETSCWHTFNTTDTITRPFSACPTCPLKPFGINNCLAVPIRTDEKGISGIVVVADLKPRQHTQVHLPTLQIIANHLGRVIRQAEDSLSLRRYARRTAFFLKINQQILSAQSPQDIGQTVLNELQKILPEHCSSILIFNMEQRRATALALSGSRISPLSSDPELPFQCQAFIDRLSRGDTIFNTCLKSENKCQVRTAMESHGIESFMCIPLIMDKELIGSLNLCSIDHNIFTPEHKILTEELAYPLVISLQKAILLKETLQQRQEVLDLAQRLANLQETERKDLARDLHDSLGQNLAGLGINLQIISNQIQPHTTDKLTERLDDAMALTATMTEQIRGIMDDLHPPVLDDYGLEAAIRRYGTQLGKRFEIAVSFKTQNFPRLEPFVESGLFRITQEALPNAARHAQAKKISITLEHHNSRPSLTIKDDGCGFDPTSIDDSNQGLGLASMRERAQQLNCSYHLSTQPGHGTQIQVEIQQ